MNQKQRLGLSIIVALTPFHTQSRAQNPTTTPQNDPNNIYFTTSTYLSGVSYVYSYSLETGQLTVQGFPILSSDVDSYQILDGNGTPTSFYVAQRFSQKNWSTRLQYFDLNGNSSQNKDMPINLYDIAIKNGVLYLAGYNKKEMAISNLDLSQIYQPRQTVQGFDPDTTVGDPNSFHSILFNNTSSYVVTVGSQSLNSPAKVFQLAQNVVGFPLKSWIIQTPTGEICTSLYSAQKISSSQEVVSCNPDWSGGYALNNPTELDLILIDVSSEVPTFKTLLTKKSNGQVTDFLIGGISQDKSAIFITEEKSASYPDTISKAYWLSISNPQEIIPVANAAMYVTYNTKSQVYIYSCYLSGSSLCQPNTFANANQMNETPMPFHVNYEASNVRFFKQVQSL